MILVSDLAFDGVKKIQLRTHIDQRGSFTQIYSSPFYDHEGIHLSFVQDNYSYSVKGTIRGMHFQSTPGQAKLITPIEGKIYDVFVDIRKDSPTFGKWDSCILDAKQRDQLYLPAGFAHGFAALESVHLIYKVSAPFNPETEITFRYDDPEIGIAWPFEEPILSEKDRHAPRFFEVIQ